jgi:hypothetical protein
MSAATERLLVIEAELGQLRDEVHERLKLRDTLLRERSSILIGITFAERQEYERALMARVAAPLDAISAVRRSRWA